MKKLGATVAARGANSEIAAPSQECGILLIFIKFPETLPFGGGSGSKFIYFYLEKKEYKSKKV